MHTRPCRLAARAPRLLALLLLATAAAASAPAMAQSPGTVRPGATTCTALTTLCAGDGDCLTAPEEGVACIPVTLDGVTSGRCGVRTAAFCCTLSTELITCPDGFMCRGGIYASVSDGLCLRDDADYCDASMERVRRCHTSPQGLSPVSYDEGDCDGDGVTNGAERAAGTDPCAAPSDRLAVWVPRDDGTAECRMGVTSCAPPGSACALEDGEPGRCVADETTGRAAPLCAPPPGLFCCGTHFGLECPTGDDACVLPSDVADAPGVCTNRRWLCGDDEASIWACHRSPDGQLARGEDGDCDGDGVPNALELELGRDPCVAEEPLDGGVARDGGVASADGGRASDGGGASADAGRRDASVGLDGAAVFDAASEPGGVPSFSGGGGCACRAAGWPRRLGGLPFLLSSLALAVALRRSRRRRSAPRRSAPCRSGR